MSPRTDAILLSDPSPFGPGRSRRSIGDIGAGDEIRTRDPQLGKLMLYQLSYTRVSGIVDVAAVAGC